MPETDSIQQEMGRAETRRIPPHSVASRPVNPAQHDYEYRRRRPLPESRLRWLAVLAAAWACVITGRLIYLQVIRYDHYRALADRQHVTTIDVPATRGTISDRDGRTLAISLPSRTVCINPRLIPDPGMAARLLAHVLEMDPAALSKKIHSARAARSGFLRVKRRISEEEVRRLKALSVDWIELRNESKRIYPNKSLAANLLGGVNDAEQGDFGVELTLDKILGGVTGTERVVRDVRGRRVHSILEKEPRPGDRLVLTINANIQFATENALRAAAEEHHCATGSVVVLRAGTNEILALANYPGYDPNERPTPETMAQRANLAVSSPGEPGSVFKTITISGAINEGKVTPATLVNCHNGAFHMFGRVIHEAKNGYGVLAVSQVYAKSSNIGAIQVALRLGSEAFHKYMVDFGLGSPTGVPLPGESGGRVWPVKRWQKTSIASMAMGHEVSATTLQLAAAASVMANGGVWIRPKLVLRQERPDGKLVPQPAETPRRVLSPEAAIEMRKLMEEVVLHGTGGQARLKGYTSGGKTGSAQIYDFETKRYTSRYNASFMGMAPITNPAVVVMVTLNGATRFGGVVAAPVFREVAQAALRILDVPRDIPENVVEEPDSRTEDDTADLSVAGLSEMVPDLGEPRREHDAGSAATAPDTPPVVAGLRVPDFRGKSKRTVIEESTAAGLETELAGQGIARAQIPVPGSVLPPGGKIRVQFAR